MKKIFEKYKNVFWSLGSFPTIPVTPTWISSEMCGIANWMFYFLMILSVIMVVVAAYLYLTSNGDPEKVGKATKSITYAAIGIVVGLLAKAIPSLMASIIGAPGISVCH
jgi:hypothetical protein